jgi:hypothetical protein
MQGFRDEAAEAGDGRFERDAKTTRRAVFLGEIERVVRWPRHAG